MPSSPLLALQFGLEVLVDQLRKSDARGAPLLFQAVSKRSHPAPAQTGPDAAPTGDIDCLRRVSHLLEESLGRHGLVQQVMATDIGGKNILMHAAASGSHAVFEEVMTMWNGAMNISGSKGIEEGFLSSDSSGRTLLHHAAESGSYMTLKTVIIRLSEKKHVCEEIVREDNRGRTAAMCILSRYPREQTREVYKTMEEKLNLLIETLGGHEHGPDVYKSRLLPRGSIVDAARGGWSCLILALQKRAEIHQGTRLPKFRDVLKQVWSEDSQPGINREDHLGVVWEALVLNFEDDPSGPTSGERSKRDTPRGLLAQAALGGQFVVLRRILKVGCFLPAPGDRNSPELRTVVELYFPGNNLWVSRLVGS